MKNKISNIYARLSSIFQDLERYLNSLMGKYSRTPDVYGVQLPGGTKFTLDVKVLKKRVSGNFQYDFETAFLLSTIMSAAKLMVNFNTGVILLGKDAATKIDLTKDFKDCPNYKNFSLGELRTILAVDAFLERARVSPILKACNFGADGIKEYVVEVSYNYGRHKLKEK